MLLGIKWYQYVSSDEVQCRTNQPALTEIIHAQCLTLFRHIARLDDSVHTKQILMLEDTFVITSDCVVENGSKMTWTPTNSHGLKQSTHNRPLWRLLMTSDATLS